MNKIGKVVMLATARAHTSGGAEKRDILLEELEICLPQFEVQKSERSFDTSLGTCHK